MSLVKVPLLLTATIANHIGTTPPQAPPAPDEVAKEVTVGERIFTKTVRVAPRSAQFIVYAGSLCEVAVLIARTFPAYPLAQHILRLLTWGSTSSAERIGITPTFAIGCGLAMLGGTLRAECYRALGRLFTYEITLRRGHQLVTDGPYSWVRHPSYTAHVIVSLGTFLCHSSRGSWVRESGVLNTPVGKTMAYAWVAWTTYLLIRLCSRPPEEDRLLRKQFGEEWDQWAAKVPYRLFPGIY
ncbi:ICMT-domain-containing protein [Obba rivulosa]|uniref:Protein-S-isoprenylcysteine O-methyltransferase n=1 Tax=Obba rivulosa TaxID=1052685 RepID=A0A8E2DS23_9APHY|nr:ICMT-domain-containing protein [Obba rivulosa]